MKITPNSVHCGDALELLQTMPDASVDLVFYSPPYGKQRKYGELDFKLTGEDYVAWSVEIYRECYRVSKGLTACVIEGATKRFVYDATPILIAADLKRAGVKLRKPPIFHRFGIPGSGGPDWLRNDYEFVICASHGKLPWSDNTADIHRNSRQAVRRRIKVATVGYIKQHRVDARTATKRKRTNRRRKQTPATCKNSPSVAGQWARRWPTKTKHRFPNRWPISISGRFARPAVSC